MEQGPPLDLEAPLVRGPDFSSIRLVRVSPQTLSPSPGRRRLACMHAFEKLQQQHQRPACGCRLCKLQASNILGVQSKPFAPETHVFEPDEYEDPVRWQRHCCPVCSPVCMESQRSRGPYFDTQVLQSQLLLL